MIQLQIPIFSQTTKGSWVLRFDDILADALELGALKNKDFLLSEELLDYIEKTYQTLPQDLPQNCW